MPPARALHPREVALNVQTLDLLKSTECRLPFNPHGMEPRSKPAEIHRAGKIDATALSD